MDEVTRGGQVESGVTVTKMDKGEGEERDGHLRAPPVVLGKHRACLYPWRQTLSAMSLRGVGRGGGGLH